MSAEVLEYQSEWCEYSNIRLSFTDFLKYSQDLICIQFSDKETSQSKLTVNLLYKIIDSKDDGSQLMNSYLTHLTGIENNRLISGTKFQNFYLKKSSSETIQGR